MKFPAGLANEGASVQRTPTAARYMAVVPGAVNLNVPGLRISLPCAWKVASELSYMFPGVSASHLATRARRRITARVEWRGENELRPARCCMRHDRSGSATRRQQIG
jgi:hypothetical protein